MYKFNLNAVKAGLSGDFPVTPSIEVDGVTQAELKRIHRNKREENPQAYEGKRTAFNSPNKTFYTGRIQQDEKKQGRSP